MIRRFFIALILIQSLVSSAIAQDLNTVRDEQFTRLKNYVLEAIRPNGLVRDSIVLSNPDGSFHPATPDAAGFALVALSALNQVGKLTDLEAEQHVENILRAHLGQTPGVTPTRSAANGYFIHSMNVNNGAYLAPWDDSYTPIGTALLVAGAQFARNHFSDHVAIRTLTNELTTSVNFNRAIKSDLSGGIYLDMGAAGNGIGNTVASWNEFMLVESLALREADNSRALAVKHKWLDTDFIPKKSYSGISTLTDNVSTYAPAFWVQQMQFFNGDFRHSADFQTYFTNQRDADQRYSADALGQAYRYGLTAGLIPHDPNDPVDPDDPFDTFFGYHADRIGVGDTFNDHPYNVFSPEAVAAWGVVDAMDTLLQFHEAQNPGPNPSTNPSYQFGMVRVATAPPPDQPNWIPPDAALVDHLFLLFGLVESLHPNFFSDRVFSALQPGDFNADGIVHNADYELWRSQYGSTTHLAADGNSDGIVDAADYTVWRNSFTEAMSANLSWAIPEPSVLAMVGQWVLFQLVIPGRRRRCNERMWSKDIAFYRKRNSSLERGPSNYFEVIKQKRCMRVFAELVSTCYLLGLSSFGIARTCKAARSGMPPTPPITPAKCDGAFQTGRRGGGCMKSLAYRPFSRRLNFSPAFAPDLEPTCGSTS